MTGRHVVVVGAGPAGLAAADAALAAGAEVTLIDSAERPGGQYHRMLPEAYEATDPGALQHGYRSFDRRSRRVLGHPRCSWWAESSVWALERRDSADDGPPLVHVLRGTPRRRHVLEPDALVLAVGAHDRVLPFPGWDLPGVYTAGAAQALAKGERVVVGDRVVVAGTGPFLLPVATSLLEAGSRVLAVVEAAGPAAVARGWLRRPWELTSQLGKSGELLSYTARLGRHRVPYRMGRAVVEARGDGRVEEIVTARVRADWSVVPGSEHVTAVDALCVGHGFTPQLELPVAAGCDLRPAAGGSAAGSPADVFVSVDDDQRTSRPGVYAAGEITGVAGAPAARAEGAVAGWIAAGGDRGARALVTLGRSRDQGRAFAARLALAHPVGRAWPGWLRPDTVICRCEETTYAAVCRSAADPTRTEPQVAKLATRAGLGPCQARVCGPTVAELRRSTDQGAGPHHRPVAEPIRLGELARPPEPPPGRATPATPATPSTPTDSPAEESTS
ncbi:pyridine nucleotide-disulfide oxidoreductase [Streptomyces camponoticapitis]|uniref:Pyridine nucleotide-disulfide oxidoreductase n=1 Tax=Streptomyces camponoticapitis TaxID=1616125 RepID=A0ABQ2E851_9ACTN|nr:FAD/NAD(P)-binding oxidoreductase [Streptomyces camponoticapitis]GGK00249.1 pyridine nucleotide-disulfide oxidoreductase [Streptomyces camponoticapitis]